MMRTGQERENRMIYLGGVTLGYFHLYPVGFQPKERTDREDGDTTAEDNGLGLRECRLPAAPSRLFGGTLSATARNHR